MLAVSSLHLALARVDRFDQILKFLIVDVFDVRNGTVLKTFKTTEWAECSNDIDAMPDIWPLGMLMSETKLWINLSEHTTLLLRFS